jgi:uncharacterized protein YbjT (DUF2867 family)
LQPPHFWEIWCSPALGFDAAAGKARLFGDGEGTNSWISLLDVSRAAVAALERPAARGRVLAFGGPEPLSQRAIVRRFEAATGRAFELERVPLEVLHGQAAGAGDALERSFAALMAITGEGGWVLDPAEARAVLGIELTSIDGFVAAAAGTAGPAAP